MCSSAPACNTRVYPRVCGGADLGDLAGRAQEGLSPRVRGSLHRGTASRPGAGSIPACAGEPRPESARRGRCRVYPRVCGGAAQLESVDRPGEGLSPRVRGSHESQTVPVEGHGSIPACAGEPNTVGLPPDMIWVYPRVCGGAAGGDNTTTRIWGLSPRVRGSHTWRTERQEARGSIPACAGEPGVTLPGSSLLRVYPRVCGGAVLFQCG